MEGLELLQVRQDGGVSRRRFFQTAAAWGAAMLASGPAGAQIARAMIMHRDPGCGCCLGWVRHARNAGFQVSVREQPDMTSLKRRLGVPARLASCHTVEVGGFVVEGHVPLADVTRLLRERPRGVRGIAVPGMPIGSPGMEAPGGERQAFETLAFDFAGGWQTFARHPASR
jgi:hypothetical protein